MNKQDLKVPIISASDAVQDIKRLLLKAFDLTPTNKPLSYKGLDIKIQDLMVCSNTIKEEIKWWNEEKYGDLLEKILLGLFQLGYQNGALKVANEYEWQINQRIQKNEEIIGFGEFSEKGVELLKSENNALIAVSIDIVRYNRHLNSKLKNVDLSNFPKELFYMNQETLPNE